MSELDAALQALADGNRRAILALVRERPRAVGEIAEQAGISQQTASHHLRVLRDAGLLAERREGTRHLFVVRAEGLAIVREFVEDLWPTSATVLRNAAEAVARQYPERGDR